MILRSSFIKLQKEDMKRRIWSIALLSLLFFIILPVFNALNLESNSITDKKEWIIDSILGYIGPQQYVIAVLTIAAAVICGISGFFYLHSKKQVDFYHSIPVSRKTLLAVKYINGFLVFFIPYFINMALSIIIIAIKGFLYIEVLQAAIAALPVYCM
jgi:ABC-2 type transport system permease protein